MRRYDYDLNATEYHVALLESSFVHLWNVIMAVVTHYGCTLSSTVEPRNNSLAFKGSPSIKVNILRF